MPSVKRGPEKLPGTRVLGLAGGIRLELRPRATTKEQSSTHVGDLISFMQNHVTCKQNLVPRDPVSTHAQYALSAKRASGLGFPRAHDVLLNLKR